MEVCFVESGIAEVCATLTSGLKSLVQRQIVPDFDASPEHGAMLIVRHRSLPRQPQRIAWKRRTAPAKKKPGRDPGLFRLVLFPISSAAANPATRSRGSYRSSFLA